MKISKILPVTICAAMLGGCGSSVPTKNNEDSDNKINVVCTVFPQYDWAREIIGDSENVNLTLLVDNGTDFHSYQPGTDDMVTIASCDVLIYIGGESDNWIQDSLTNATNPDMKKVNLTEIISDTLLEEACTLEGHDHEHDEHVYDEHVWLSLRNAEIFTEAIAKAISDADVENAAVYAENAKNYTAKLKSANMEFQAELGIAKRNTLLFADRFPFVYLMQDYGFEYFAAFPGCSSETDASFETIIKLASAIDENSLPCVLTIDGSDSSIAEAVIANTADKNQKVLALNSMQIVSSKDIDAGMTYLSVMESNLDVLTEALS